MSNAPMTPLQLVPRLTGTTGERIQSARKFHRLKQDDLLAAMRKIDPALVPVRKTLSGWENDRKSPTVAEIRLVARATGFPVEDFVTERDATVPGPEGPGTDAQYPPWDSNPEPADSGRVLAFRPRHEECPDQPVPLALPGRAA